MMGYVRKFIGGLVMLAVLIAAGYSFVTYYGLIFAKTVAGEVIGIERVSDPGAIINTQGSVMPPTILYSFAVAIKGHDGTIITGSSEDRQWAVVHKGQCAEARFLPYPPWDLVKAGTYHGVRLMRMFTCPEAAAAAGPNASTGP